MGQKTELLLLAGLYLIPFLFAIVCRLKKKAELKQ